MFDTPPPPHIQTHAKVNSVTGGRLRLQALRKITVLSESTLTAVELHVCNFCIYKTHLVGLSAGSAVHATESSFRGYCKGHKVYTLTLPHKKAGSKHSSFTVENKKVSDFGLRV